MRRKTWIPIILIVVLIILLAILIKLFDSENKSGAEGSTSTAAAGFATEGFVGGNGDVSAVTEPRTDAPTEEQTSKSFNGQFLPTDAPTAGGDVELYGAVYPYNTERIDISGTAVEDLDYLIDRLLELPMLNYIDMCDCGLSNETMEELMKRFPDVKFVWKVTLGLWTIRTDCVAFSTLKDGTITYRLTNDDVKVLKYCTDMVALDLGHNKVTDISFLQYMPKLRILILVDNRVEGHDDLYISDLSWLRYTPELRYLEFFVGSVSDISFLYDLPNLVDLNISYNPISEVEYLMKLPRLERLYIEHTLLTEEDYKLLQQTYPDAQIVYYGEGSVDQGWREHERYFAMIDMYHNNYVNELFLD
ncbi:MAG: hypothetical protein NC223_07410 [Butyrivibrio sp.]|nr:hypothetical protein [Butyrivibrio sp.]